LSKVEDINDINPQTPRRSIEMNKIINFNIDYSPQRKASNQLTKEITETNLHSQIIQRNIGKFKDMLK